MTRFHSHEKVNTMKPLYMDFDFYVEYSEGNTWKNIANINHFHNSYEIYYLLENELFYHINNEIFHVKPGMLMVIPPNVVHTTNYFNSKSMERKRLLINLPLSYIDMFLKDDPNLLSRLLMPPFKVDKSRQKEVLGLFNKILYEYQKENGNVALTKAYLVQLLVLLGELIKDNSCICESSTSNELILKITTCINEQYMEPLTLKYLSEKFYMNPSYISRIFKQKINVTFSEYLRNVRIKHACNLLTTTSLSLGEIAEKTGFNSTSDLCRVFKSVKEVSPLYYRKLYNS